jgi:N-acetylglucosaminyldiphosphoundecaprenol N-acetyl-beta-D-mannosaminyltransferase
MPPQHETIAHYYVSGSPSIQILGCRVSRVTVPQAIDTIEGWIAEQSREVCKFVVATGFHGIWEAHQSEAFREVLNSADMFCPDGIAPVWLSRLQRDPLPGRVPGPDLLAEFVGRANGAGYRSFFLGDTEETLQSLETRLEERYPGHRTVGRFSPPFRALSESEELDLVGMINDSHPDVLWVALGLPKQEWWIHRNRERLRVPVAVAVGAAFGFVSGRVKRAPAWIGRSGFEWVWRLAMEPRKLWRRDLIDGPRFLACALLECAGLLNRQHSASLPMGREDPDKGSIRGDDGSLDRSYERAPSEPTATVRD